MFKVEVVAETYIAVGAGGLAVIAIIWAFIHNMRKLEPRLQNLEQGQEIQTEVIRNSTDAMKEVSRSNDNIASALNLLNATNKAVVEIINKQDDRSEQTLNTIIEMKAKMEGRK